MLAADAACANLGHPSTRPNPMVSPIAAGVSAYSAFSSRPTDPPPEPFAPATTGGSDGPALNRQWLGEGFVPQGQGYGNGQVLSSYNNGTSVRLELQDAQTGEHVQDVELGSRQPPVLWPLAQTLGNHAPDKGGGVATDGEFVYLADTQGVYVYKRSDIMAASAGETVPAVSFQPTPDDASYITVKDGYAYVGQFGVRPGGIGDKDYGNDPSLTRYEIDDDGSFDLEHPTGPIATPYYAQGVAVTEKGLLFTTSYSNKDGESPKSLKFQPFDGEAGYRNFEVARTELTIFGHPLGISVPETHDVLELGYYAEEVNIVGDEVWITYESAADKFDGEGEDHIVRVPLSDLDLSGTGVTAQDLAQQR
jgi:hypothetical protein